MVIDMFHSAGAGRHFGDAKAGWTAQRFIYSLCRLHKRKSSSPGEKCLELGSRIVKVTYGGDA